MNLKDINISEVVEQVRAQLKEDPHVTLALGASIEPILMVVVMLVERFGLNSQNSSPLPPKTLIVLKPLKLHQNDLQAVRRDIRDQR